ncbi:MAG: MarR family transcriptional regulator [Rhodocyclales bacterium GT-UBC]|nr:MAG: MarR family transcriptional regulator [Rhodocyclales bacterium GT-UBC]
MSINPNMKNHQWDSSLDPEIVPLFLALQWAKAISLEAMQAPLSRFGFTPAELDVLATLRNAPAPHRLTPSRIHDEVVITSGGLTKVMLQLEARGLVTRTPSDGDQRIKPVCLTAEGRQRIEQAMSEIVAESGRWIRARLAPDEVAALTGLLNKLIPARP